MSIEKGIKIQPDKVVVDKVYRGNRLYRRFPPGEVETAKAWLALKIRDINNSVFHDEAPVHTFGEACDLYFKHYCKPSNFTEQKREIDLIRFKYGLNDVPIDRVHNRKLEPYKKARLKQTKSRSVNHGLQATRRILRLAAMDFIDELTDKPWLDHPRPISLVPSTDKRPPKALTWAEQDRLFEHMQPHKIDQALFILNTGIRKQELPQLKWANEIKLPEINSFVFQVGKVKSGRIKFVVMNSIAKGIVNKMRGKHPDYVFSHNGRKVREVHTTAWRRACIRSGVHVTVHDLRHTCATRLADFNAPQRVISDILDHSYSNMTEFYTSGNVKMIEDYLELITERRNMVILRRSNG